MQAAFWVSPSRGLYSGNALNRLRDSMPSMAWLRWRHPCEICGTRTISGAARASGRLSPNSRLLISRTILDHRSVSKHVCDPCWNHDLELDRLPRDEQHQQALDLIAEWLDRAPSIQPPAWKREDLWLCQEFDFAEAQQQLATSAFYSAFEGEGRLSWERRHRRFNFSDTYDTAFPPDHYDNVLVWTEFHGDSNTDGTSYTGSVCRTADNTVLFTWTFLETFYYD